MLAELTTPISISPVCCLRKSSEDPLLMADTWVALMGREIREGDENDGFQIWGLRALIYFFWGGAG